MTGAGRVLQATAVSSDPTTGAEVVLDDGVRLQVSPEVLRVSVFRLLRSGQRVDLLVAGPVVTWLGLPGTAAREPSGG